MAKFYYLCKSCGEDFDSSTAEVVCSECLSSNIVGGETGEEEEDDN
jgi:DNA-directed RNA polymerase subunit RPC12/RpoP